MQVCNTIEALAEATLRFRNNSNTIGFVPTMGALHKGHGSLIQKALSKNDLVVVSIFVNPTQFNNPSDLKKYPRPFKQDVEFLSNIDPNIVVFAPSPNQLYGTNVVATSYKYGGIEFEMEGAQRPGHFDGVGTVLNLLFRAVKPTHAYFGEKDFQQLQIVRELVRIEKLPITVVGCPIFRAESGLAMSSRNMRLTNKQLEVAPFIYKTLKEAKNLFKHKSIPFVNNWVLSQFKGHPTLEIEYFQIAATDNLAIAKRKHKSNTYRGFIAVFAGEVRLIDNIALN